MVAFPTDTFYGLAVDPMSASAVERLFALKGRPADAALPLIAGSFEQVTRAVGPLGERGTRLAARFWPGPLSLLCDAPGTLVPAVHAGTGAVAVRVPDHPVARGFALLFGAPITATSANRSGEPPARSGADLAAIAGHPDLFVIDAGETAGGAPATIVDARGRPPRLVRAGAIAWERVLESLQA